MDSLAEVHHEWCKKISKSEKDMIARFIWYGQQQRAHTHAAQHREKVVKIVYLLCMDMPDNAQLVHVKKIVFKQPQLGSRGGQRGGAR